MKKILWLKLAMKKKLVIPKILLQKFNSNCDKNSKYDKTETPIVTRPKQSKCTEKTKELKLWQKFIVPRQKKKLTKLENLRFDITKKTLVMKKIILLKKLNYI